ncbi:MAG: MGMT family protein [Verrucomicrobiota bacterium]
MSVPTLLTGLATSPHGTCLLTGERTCLYSLAFVDPDEANVKQTADKQRDDAWAQALADRIFSGQAVDYRAPGTPFQEQVWAQLIRIPQGETRTYADIAAAIGQPKAVRAVGTAVGRNPLAYLIPCHRVVRSDGTLGGYRWGGQIKQRLLAAESAGQRSVA